MPGLIPDSSTACVFAFPRSPRLNLRGAWAVVAPGLRRKPLCPGSAAIGIVLALAVMAVLGQSLVNIILVIALFIAPGASRVVRGAVRAVKQETLFIGAQALGASPGRFVARHVLPNVFAPILVIATVWLGNAIVIEAALSFLGLGTPPPTPTWGGMLGGEGGRELETAPHPPSLPRAAVS